MKKKLILLVIIAFTYVGAMAQAALHIGNDYFNDLRFQKAIGFYMKAIKRKPSFEATERLADCYRLTKDYPRAEFWYSKAITFPETNANTVYQYGQMLKINEKYTKAKLVFEQYKNFKSVNPEFATKLINSCDSAAAWQNLPSNVVLSNKRELNSVYSDFGIARLSSVAYAYSSNRPSLSKDLLAKDLETPYYDILIARLSAENEVTSVAPFKIERNTKYHIATPSFSSNFDTVYFTQTTLQKNRKESINRLSIYYSVRKDSVWTSPFPIAYNNNDYSLGHPYLSPSGSELYFVSDIPGGFGGFDVYRCKFVNGSWGSPENLGAAVNSPENEFYPTLNDNKLYFSSQGHIGFGGLDIFVSEKNADGNYTSIKNLKAPFNSPQDDFGISFDEEKSTGFLSSNRIGGLGLDDIYSFEVLPAKTPDYYLAVVPYYLDKGERVVIEGCGVQVTNKANLKEATTTNRYYKTYYNVEDKNIYTIKVRKDGYLNTADVAAIKDFKVLDTVILREGLRPDLAIILEYPVRMDELALNRSFVLENIYYDFNKADIREDAATELNKLVDILNENPRIKIQLGSYCDSRGDDFYNQDLSQKRAQAVVNYLVKKGISRKRLTAKGFGETRLLNKCSNGVTCTDEEHQINRRTDFQILEVEK